MTTEAVAGFWSYAHDDNSLDEGAILKLAHLISDEYNLLSGEKLTLFIDRDDILWGDTWRERIESALTRTTFLIPIITPRYFTRTECRKELLQFSAQVKGLGVEKLLLPILYARPHEFTTDSSDEAVALVASTQYVDWTEARLLEPSSRAYRSHVNALARRLIEIAEEVARQQFSDELTADLEVDASDGIADVMEEITGLLPAWLDAVMANPLVRSQIQAAWHEGEDQLDRLKRSGARAPVITAAGIRICRELLPLLERSLQDAEVYLSKSAQLDPLIINLIRLVNDHPESYPLVSPVREAIDEAMRNILQDERTQEYNRNFPGKSIDQFFSEKSHLGRIFQKSASVTHKTRIFISEGNSIVRRWDVELVSPGDESGPAALSQR